MGNVYWESFKIISLEAVNKYVPKKHLKSNAVPEYYNVHIRKVKL